MLQLEKEMFQFQKRTILQLFLKKKKIQLKKEFILEKGKEEDKTNYKTARATSWSKMLQNVEQMKLSPELA